MLAILYVTSAVASFFTPIYEDREEYRCSFQTTKIAIISGIIFLIPMIKKIIGNISSSGFWPFFWVFSLIVWLYAFLLDDRENLLNYLMCALLGSAVLSFLCSNIYFTNYTVPCNQTHNYTERVSLVTTTESGESIYGDGFTVGLMEQEHLTTRIYQYSYQAENGDIKSKKIYENRTQITYIDADEEPYIEIHYEILCSGFRIKSNSHIFRHIYRTYHLYIPKNSIADITPTG